MSHESGRLSAQGHFLTEREICTKTSPQAAPFKGEVQDKNSEEVTWTDGSDVMQEISEIDLRAGQRKAVTNESFSAEHFERLLDSHEAAALLRVHPKTLQRMARERKIAGVKVGKSWRFRISELNRFVQTKIAS